MIESKYNLCLQDNTGMIIYNAKADEIVALNPHLAELYNQYRKKPEELSNHHSELFQMLVDKGFWVEEGLDEPQDFINQCENREEENREYTITVIPTLACNMKCWYCYENHENKPAMNDSVKQAVILFIEKLLATDSYQKLHLSFFGGEPLLYFDKIVLPILRQAHNLCAKRNVEFSVHFTTNAFLLTSDVLQQLESLDVSFQITLDGNEHVHNTIRMTKGNEPTYTTIIHNIKAAIKSGLKVGVRCNYTYKTLPTFIDVITDFKNLDSNEKSLLNFTFERIWQDDSGDYAEIEHWLKRLETAFENEGLHTKATNDYKISMCYADQRNTVVINYNGDLYKCTARDFTTKNREGKLTPDGNLEWNDKHKKRQAIRWGTETCQQCRIYPICHGGCSQMKLEYTTLQGCPKGFDKEQIDNIMRNRALYILNSYKKLCRKE